MHKIWFIGLFFVYAQSEIVEVLVKCSEYVELSSDFSLPLFLINVKLTLRFVMLFTEEENI